MGIDVSKALANHHRVIREAGDSLLLIGLDELHEFHNHPFHVVDNAEMDELVASIKEKGVLTPITVRHSNDGNGFEIISGHRRVHAAKRAGLTKISAHVVELDDDDAAIYMADSNLQRENILPSERAWAYRMKMEALKHQGLRADDGSRADEKVAKEAGESRDKVYRYIRLTYLVQDLLAMADSGKLPLMVAYHLSYLGNDLQIVVADHIRQQNVIPSVEQAMRLKAMYKEGSLTRQKIAAVLTPQKKVATFKLTSKELREFFPQTDEGELKELVLKAIKEYVARHNIS